MKALQAIEEFQDFVHQSGKSPEHLSSEDAVKLMADFYSGIRAEDCNLEEDGDMLLFQWGTYDWGQDELFEYDITRQFILPETFQDGDERWTEDCIWQLSLTLKYEPTSELKQVKPGNRWCGKPSEVSDFMHYIECCQDTETVRTSIIAAKKLTFERA